MTARRTTRRAAHRLRRTAIVYPFGEVQRVPPRDRRRRALVRRETRGRRWRPCRRQGERQSWSALRAPYERGWLQRASWLASRKRLVAARRAEVMHREP